MYASTIYGLQKYTINIIYVYIKCIMININLFTYHTSTWKTCYGLVIYNNKYIY